ncbi:MAG: hypothetical protein Q7U72_01030 [Brevundimonas sp.]|uniref:hypothetical protein n=1 Tax=Brevundimonas sp. TaxID=1871086 RepID=UPI002726D20E|nr:hypothetical protein [Brevundimonas sp.]MDO9076013.1 hypothetical protein [Brevundimonas sp.]MDP3079857.1 hypothetical protein [Brevundimonas sp.]MDZ4061037.1 hypothetical protein [Brevundimonas sp.]
MDWERVRHDFEWDGALRDIYVLETSEDDWQRVLDALRQWTPVPVFKRNETITPFHGQAADALSDPNGGLLSINVAGMVFNCHFFGADEIEFDLDPREVTEPEQAEAIGRFMGMLGNATGKPVILTYESGRTEIICRWSPATRTAEWIHEHRP